MATFVLVHGAFHGSWCYSRVAAALRSHGHDVHIPTLSGVGELAHLSSHSINLSTHVQDVVSVIESDDLTDVILCGHSYGGMVITGVAGQVGERIRTLLYLDAVVPEDGQSAFDIAGPDITQLLLGLAAQNGTMMEPPAAEFFQVNAKDVDWVNRMCTPHPVATFVEKLRHTGKESLVTRHTYVLCQQYPSVNHPTYAKVKDMPSWKTVSLDCGHDLMVDDPQTLTALLLDELAR